MLYPIELLRHRPAADAARRGGVHVNQHARICHSTDRAFCLPRWFWLAKKIMHSAMKHKAIIAICMPPCNQKHSNYLIYNEKIAICNWHGNC